MKEVLCYKTFDGIVFENEKEAMKHLDKLYGDILLKMSHNLVAIMKYDETAQYLNDHLIDFKKLIEIKEDMKIKYKDINFN